MVILLSQNHGGNSTDSRVCVRVTVHILISVCIQDHCVKLFASPLMRVCRRSCVRVCVCVNGGDLCRKDGEGESAYLHWQLHKGK